MLKALLTACRKKCESHFSIILGYIVFNTICFRYVSPIVSNRSIGDASNELFFADPASSVPPVAQMLTTGGRIC